MIILLIVHSIAWNDFDAIPRSCSKYGLMDHGGSRKRLMFSRRQVGLSCVMYMLCTNTIARICIYLTFLVS